MKLETAISKSLAHIQAGTIVNVFAHELWHDGDGWTSNDRWRIASGIPVESVPEHARARWEIFRANYAPRARVRDITDIGYDETVNLEVDCLPFLDIEPAR